MMKFKKAISMLMVAVMVFAVSACGGTKQAKSEEGGKTVANGKYKVAFILNCSIND